MIEYLEDIEVSPVKKAWKKNAPLTNTIQSPSMDTPIKKSDKTNKVDETINDFNKWVMPPQPQAYLKCPRYDFF